MLASVLCTPAVAASTAPAASTGIRVGALKNDGSTVVIKDCDNFEDGRNAAMELADDNGEMQKNKYERIVVDLYADWIAVDVSF